MHILLVEDNESDVQIAKKVLEEAQLEHQLSVVVDGEEALQFLGQEGPLPDIILLDLNLPKKDGHELLIEIRKEEKFQKISIFIFTSSTEEKDIFKSYQLRVNGYIQKPLTVRQIQNIIQRDSPDDFSPPFLNE